MIGSPYELPARSTLEQAAGVYRRRVIEDHGPEAIIASASGDNLHALCHATRAAGQALDTFYPLVSVGTHAWRTDIN